MRPVNLGPIPLPIASYEEGGGKAKKMQRAYYLALQMGVGSKVSITSRTFHCRLHVDSSAPFLGGDRDLHIRFVNLTVLDWDIYRSFSVAKYNVFERIIAI